MALKFFILMDLNIKCNKRNQETYIIFKFYVCECGDIRNIAHTDEYFTI